MHAEDTAELHHQLLEELSAAVTAATSRGDHHAADRYQQHRDQVTEQTQRIDTAVHTARTRLDTARAELIHAAGGVDNIVTEHHIHTHRAAVVRADTQTLNNARRLARDLNDQLSRAEAVAARAFAQNPAHSYDLAADLPQLRAEIACLEAATTTSPAALYHPPETAVAGLDDAHRRTVTAITSSPQTVQPLQIHPGADKPAALAALAATAHHHNSRILALPATRAAADYARANRYADTIADVDDARANLDTKRWKLPLGSLIIVDDADQLQPDQLRWFAETAAATNTKLVLITTADDREPAHTLLTVLTDNLPSAQHIGTPDPRRHQTPTAIQRAEHHLATSSATNLTRTQATQLLQRRNQLIDRLRDIADTTAHIDTASERSRERSRGNDHSSGLEL